MKKQKNNSDVYRLPKKKNYPKLITVIDILAILAFLACFLRSVPLDFSSGFRRPEPFLQSETRETPVFLSAKTAEYEIPDRNDILTGEVIRDAD